MEHPLLLGFAFAAWAVAALGVVPALWRRSHLGARVGAGLLALSAALIAVAAVLQLDGPSLEPQRTLEGRLHVAAGRSALAAQALGVCLGLGSVVGRRAAATAVALLLAGFAVPVVLSPSSVGLTQRVLVGVELAALLALARRLDVPALR